MNRPTAGDLIEAPSHHHGSCFVVSLPTEPVRDSDPARTPLCAYCNDETAMMERKWESVKQLIEDNANTDHIESVVNDPHYGATQAEHALVDMNTFEVVAFTCPSCISGAGIIAENNV